MKLRKKYLVAAMAAAMTVSGVNAADEVQDQTMTQLQFTSQLNLSSGVSPEVGDDAFKTKLVRLGNGALVSVFGDAVDSTKVVYDLKGDAERPARDIFIRTCASATADCSLEENWSEPVNVSETALLSSMDTDWDGPETDGATRKPYYGDSDKPNISNGGANIMVTWTDKYCGDGTNQRSVSYLTRESREVPFSCTWARKASVNAGGALTWQDKVQLSDGTRDAKQDVSKINLAGNAVITWQEDPLGLQIGSADGPGDGASGATASHGTDIWIASKTEAGGYTAATRLTDNYDGVQKASGNHNEIKNAAGVVVDDADIDGGQASATRANTGLVGSTVVVAYEETKGSEGLAIGKLIRYHAFPFGDVATAAATGPDNLNQAGCIISNPLENARRVRFMPQTDAMMANVNAVQGDADSGLRIGIIWKEGQYDQGGPSDIMARVGIKTADVGSTGLLPSDMVPAVDAANCATSDYLVAEDLNNTLAWNLSSNTKAGTNNLTDTTETNNIENALAHRGAIVGNDLYVGFNYTTDWALATYTDLVNHDFWLRHYDATTGEWTTAKNLSNLPTTDINVREPRFVKTPYSDDGSYNPSAFVIAWGSQTNVASHIEDAEDLDIFYTRSFDKGVTMEPVVRVDNPNGNSRFESQLRPTPSGETVYAVWNESDGTTTNAAFSVATSGDVTGEDPYDGLIDGVTTKSSSSGGCTVSGNAKFDPVLPAILASALAFLGFRRYRNQG
ncbi:MAG: choice-of-anchor O protein [Thiomicrorhabdus chilensis]|uniref:choice-of-anchor O protein n=1 Tax=Thiomicrorhabdus chilensis TaxID=63656 RepID=UPI00299E5CF6|nr:choice-of-anchor O protein [Thiomicrorhabdus chilensis]MDX1347886.1 choice-of-anchor O protein [Thiomicrorhabdus chilensis]